jgi:hypothetical protein
VQIGKSVQGVEIKEEEALIISPRDSLQVKGWLLALSIQSSILQKTRG